MGNRVAASLSGRGGGGGAGQVRASRDWLRSGHYLDALPLRGLDTVQRSRVLNMGAGNRTAWSLLIRLSIKRNGMQRSGQVLPFPSHTAPLSKSRSGVKANLSSRFSLCRHHAASAAAQRHLPPSLSLSPCLSVSLSHAHTRTVKHTDSCFCVLWMYGNTETQIFMISALICMPRHLSLSLKSR